MINVQVERSQHHASYESLLVREAMKRERKAQPCRVKDRWKMRLDAPPRYLPAYSRRTRANNGIVGTYGGMVQRPVAVASAPGRGYLVAQT